MKRLYIHIACLLAAGLALVLAASCERAPGSPAAMRINERVVTEEEFSDLVKEAEGRDPSFRRSEKGIHALAEETITKELLIQEAVRRGLDRTDSFRWSIKNYYEQTLIKDLVEALVAETDAVATEEELREAYSLMGSVYRIDLYVVGRSPRYMGGGAGGGELGPLHMDLVGGLKAGACERCHFTDSQMDVTVDPSAAPIKLSRALKALTVGGLSEPVEVEGKYHLMFLKGVEKAALPQFESVEVELGTLVREEKHYDAMARRIGQLRDDAEITLDRGIVGRQAGR